MRTTWVLLAGLTAACVACKGDDTSTRDVGLKSEASNLDAATMPEDSVMATESTSPPREDRGVITEGARAVLECRFHDGFTTHCEPYRDWLEALKSGLANERDRQAIEASLVEMVSDDDHRIRYLGALGLARHGLRYKTELTLAEELVKALASEGEAVVGAQLANVVVRIKLEVTGLKPKVAKLVIKHRLAEVRSVLVGELLYHQGLDFFELTWKSALEDSATSVRVSALSAFWIGGAERSQEVCALWRQHIGSSEDAIAEKASFLLSFWGACEAHYDALLDEQARRAMAGTMTWSYISSLAHLLRDNVLDDVRRGRVIAVLRQVVEVATNGWSARSRAMELLKDKDPDAMSFIERFRADASPLIKAKAQKLLGAMTESR